jgi:hypothetical protein
MKADYPGRSGDQTTVYARPKNGRFTIPSNVAFTSQLLLKKCLKTHSEF